jgi:hypothetical protein
MATYLDLVLQNFRWCIESVVPTSTAVQKRFTQLEPSKHKGSTGGVSSGWVRTYDVAWQRSDADAGPKSMYSRIADHHYLVTVRYPTVVLPDTELQQLIALDRHDLIHKLEEPATWVGVSDAAPSTAIDLMSRFRETDALDKRNPQLWLLQLPFKTKVRERQHA